MYLYLFLSVIVICITILICYILNNFRDISYYYEYKIDHLELEKLKDEYNENIIKYQTQVEELCNNVKKLRVLDSNYNATNTRLICLMFDINNILNNNTDNDKIVKKIKTELNNTKL